MMWREGVSSPDRSVGGGWSEGVGVVAVVDKLTAITPYLTIYATAAGA
jgi:hypothetical protein